MCGLVRSDGGMTWLAEQVWPDISPGVRLTVMVEMERPAVDPDLTLNLECFELGGKQRTWHRTWTASGMEVTRA